MESGITKTEAYAKPVAANSHIALHINILAIIGTKN